MLVGLIGNNILRSRTPRMHEVEGARQGLNYRYQIVDTAPVTKSGLGVAELVDAARLFGFAGLNVTYPFKQSIMPHLDEIAPDAARVGAVNTVVIENGRTCGYNTDCWGFARGFTLEMADAKRSTVLQLGAGGAGSAVAQALIDCGVEHLIVADLDGEKANVLAERLKDLPAKVTTVSPVEIADLSFDGLVNTTPVGMDKAPGMPVPANVLDKDIWVADIVYFPLETELLRRARAAGRRTFSGAAMAVFQAVKAFELFTGLPADAEAMKATFNSFEISNSAAVASQ